ncbi:MAG: nucleotidyltransferase domain-containing protein [Janthinobacterium lividum]
MTAFSLDLIVPMGTQVVVRPDAAGDAMSGQQRRGAVAEIIGTPADAQHAYRIRFAEGAEVSLRRTQFSILKQVKIGPLGDAEAAHKAHALEQYVIYRCVVGSQAYGLNREGSDVDRRGIYLPPAALEWSLYGVPEQLESPETEECYWELKKFMVLALKANPNILECLFTLLVEQSSEIADAILAKRHIFLSKLVYQTYNGYVMSQFKRLEQDLRATGELKWKHAMHLIRLLLQGISVLQEAHVPVLVAEHREALLAIRDGERPWADVNAWRLSLHGEFDRAFQTTSLPDAPDYAEANRLLVWARSKMVEATA